LRLIILLTMNSITKYTLFLLFFSLVLTGCNLGGRPADDLTESVPDTIMEKEETQPVPPAETQPTTETTSAPDTSSVPVADGLALDQEPPDTSVTPETEIDVGEDKAEIDLEEDEVDIEDDPSADSEVGASEPTEFPIAGAPPPSSEPQQPDPDDTLHEEPEPDTGDDPDDDGQGVESVYDGDDA